MDYPKWVNEPGLPDEERTRRRITYVLKKAALRVDPRGSVTRLAEAAGLERSYLHRFLEHHRLSESATQKLLGVMTVDEIKTIKREVWLLHNKTETPNGVSR